MNPRELTLALGGCWHGSQGMALCPAHDDGKTPALSIRPGDRREIVLKCHAGCTTRAVIAALRQRGLWPGAGQVTPQVSILQRREREEQTRQRQEKQRAEVAALWRRAGAIGGSLAERYLRGRGITIPLPPTLRYLILKHPGTGLPLPCMVAAVTDRAAASPVAAHRTWTKLDGTAKAPVTSPRMLLGSPGSGAIRLAPAGDTLGLAEGIETGLSAMQLFAIPVWCAINDTRLPALELPAEAERIVIFADHDRVDPKQGFSPGLQWAERAARIYRAQGRTVAIKAPDGEGQDWNDMLLRRLLRIQEGAQ